MNFGLSFSYVFKDEEWFKKIIIPALVSLIPIIGQLILMGWGLSVTKNVIDGRSERALPKLEFGADLGRGFMVFLIQFIYAIPYAILFGLMSAAFGIGGGAREEIVQILMTILGICFGLVGFLLALLILFMSVAAIANYAAKGEFKAAFQFKEIFALLKKSFVSWLLVLVGGFIAMGIIAPLGSVACGIGIILTTAYGTAVYYHMLGQAYVKSVSPPVTEAEVL